MKRCHFDMTIIGIENDDDIDHDHEHIDEKLMQLILQ